PGGMHCAYRLVPVPYWYRDELGTLVRTAGRTHVNQSHFEDEIPPEDKPGLPIRSLPTEGLEARGGRDLVVPVQHFSPHNLLHRGRRRGERRRRTHRDQPNPIRNNSRKNRVRSGRRWLGFEEGETGRRVIRKKSKGIIVYMELIVQPTGDLTN
ncbi:hypothetical protein BHE74_00054543, partial [Ensete ventricosum]